MIGVIIAIAPVVPVLVALGLGAAATGAWLWSRDDADQLPPGKKPGGTGGGDTPGKGAPSELVEQFEGTYTDGKFHNTMAGDSVNKLVTKTLNAIAPGQGNKPAMIGALRRLLNTSEFNRKLFGEAIAGDNYLIDGIGINRFAQPKHEDTVEVMRLGFVPERNINANGSRVGPSQKWGDPWVPRLSRDAVIAGISDPAILLGPAWADGTPATEPPPELLAVLEERA